jgi:hypothetical protein
VFALCFSPSHVNSYAGISLRLHILVCSKLQHEAARQHEQSSRGTFRMFRASRPSSKILQKGSTFTDAIDAEVLDQV